MLRLRATTAVAVLSLFLLLLVACGEATTDPAPGAADPGDDAADEPGDDPGDAVEEDAPTALEELIAAADEEGVLYYGDSVSPEIMAAAEAAFNERWGTDIRIELVSGRAVDLLVRMQQEYQVGRLTIDSTHVSSSLVFGTLRDHPDFFDQFDYISVFEDEMPGIRDVVERVPEPLIGYGLEGNHLARLVVYNTDLVAPEDVPQSWDDLLDSQWSGRRIGADPAGSSTHQNIVAWDRERLLEYSSALADQDPLWVAGDEIFESLARGETHIAIATSTRLGNLLADWPDAPVAIAPVEFVPVTQQIIFVAADAPNLNAARLYAAWQAVEGFPLFTEQGHVRERVWADAGTWAAQELADIGVDVLMLDQEEDLEEADRVRAEIVEDLRRRGVER